LRSRRSLLAEFAGVFDARDLKGASELGQLARRLEEEKIRAVAAVRMIRRMASAGMPVPLPSEWITVGIVDGLTAASAEVVDRSPAQGRALAETTVAVAIRLDATYPPAIRISTVAQAWTQLAIVHSRGGDLQSSLGALDRADEALAERSARPLTHDKAIVDAARATVLYALGRDEEALALLRAASLSFRTLGDTRRKTECDRMTEIIRQ
jgi:hypothetical protein